MLRAALLETLSDFEPAQAYPTPLMPRPRPSQLCVRFHIATGKDQSNPRYFNS